MVYNTMLLWVIKFVWECANHNRMNVFFPKLKFKWIQFGNIVNIPSYKCVYGWCACPRTLNTEKPVFYLPINVCKSNTLLGKAMYVPAMGLHTGLLWADAMRKIIYIFSFWFGKQSNGFFFAFLRAGILRFSVFFVFLPFELQIEIFCKHSMHSNFR